MPMRGFLRSLFSPPTAATAEIPAIRQRERAFRALDDHALRAAFRDCTDVVEVVAIVTAVASRVLQLEMFDVQLQGALGLARGRVIEMQTGEGKTLACTPAVAWLARGGRGVHVMTVNDYLARRFQQGLHFTLDEYGRNISLADEGIRAAELALRSGNLFAEENLALYTALHNAIHAHFLLRRDVDYVVKEDAIQSVDEFKGRIAQDRRWPAGLHTAIEAKEGVPFRRQGRVLGSLTLQNLVALYPRVCGMTGTAATQAGEFRTFYGLDVEVIPTNRPMIRVDEPDVLFASKSAKEAAAAAEIRSVHATGQPILVGTASVEESERLSRVLAGIPHAPDLRGDRLF